MEFDQEELATDELPLAEEEVLEFDQDDVILEQESTPDLVQDVDAESPPVEIDESEDSLVDLVDEPADVNDLTGFVL